MSVHECDGDCQATAEWRQQQIRDLTERLARVQRLAMNGIEAGDNGYPNGARDALHDILTALGRAS